MKRHIVFENNDMDLYMDFIANLIPNNTSCTLHKKIGSSDKYIPIKHVQVPVILTIKGVEKSTIIIEVHSFGFFKEKEFMLSRHFSPDKCLEIIRNGIQKIFNEIIIENNLDTDDIAKNNDIFKNLKFSSLNFTLNKVIKQK